jgi:hypothetical protein
VIILKSHFEIRFILFAKKVQWKTLGCNIVDNYRKLSTMLRVIIGVIAVTKNLTNIKDSTQFKKTNDF